MRSYVVFAPVVILYLADDMTCDVDVLCTYVTCYLLCVSTIAFLSYIRSSIAYHIVGVCVYKEDP